MRYIWQQFRNSSITVKVFLLAVLAVWAVALAGVTALLILAGGRQAVAQQPEPGQISTPAPTITLSPAVGPPNTSISIWGQNWTPGSTVLFYINPLEGLVINTFAVNSVVVDSTGQFEADVTIGGTGQAPGLLRVVARTTDSDIGAEALFSLVEAAAVLPTVTAVPTETPTTVPTPVPTQPVQPAEAQLTTAANVNVRSGPGTAYPVIGLLSSGQNARVTGLSPDGRWWQIEFPGVSTGRGWLAGAYATAQNVGNVPIVQPQPLPPTVPTATPQPVPTSTPAVITDWRGEYFDNPNLSGNPVLVRNDVAVNFNWGVSAAAPGLPADNFSARWSRALYAPAGSYRFTVRVDDGVRLWVNNSLLIDQWRDTSATTYTADLNLPEGMHQVRVEFYDHTGDALIQLGWEAIKNYPDWKGEYFNNRSLSGNPVLVRNDAAINFNWGYDSPAPNIPADSFSVRWTRKLDLPGGTYRLSAKVDDGVRVWFDDVLVIDSWQDGGTRTLDTIQKVNGGQHRLRVEYYERSGIARIDVNWQKTEVVNQPPQAILAGPFAVNEGSTLTFDGRASRDPDGNIVTYEWDFNYNDKTFNPQAAGATVSRMFDDGPATVKMALRVTDNKGASHIAAAQVNVINLPPSVEVGGSYSGQVGNTIAFVGTAVDPSPVDQPGLSYRWDFGNGTKADGPAVNYAFSQPGSYTVSLTVIDKDGGQATKSTSVMVTAPPQPPQVAISGPASALVGETVTFSATSASTIVSYSWLLSNGATGADPEMTQVFAASGSYLVTVTVTDDKGLTGTAQQFIEITEPAPEIPDAEINQG